MPRLVQLIWLALALACGTALAADGEIRWAPDLPTARRAAAQFEVPLLIHFYGDNCLPCKTLEQRVLSQAAVINTLNKYFICVRVNASIDRQTAAQYQVHSWPTDVFVSPDGQVLSQGVCKQDVSGYMDVLQTVAVSNRDRNVMLAAERKPATSAQLVANSAAAPTGNFGALASHAQTPAYPSLSGGQPNTNPQGQTGGVQAGPLSNAQQPVSLAASAPREQQMIPSLHGGPMSRSNDGLPPLPGHSSTLGVNGFNSPNRDPLQGQPGLANLPPATKPSAQLAYGQQSQEMSISNPFYQNGEAAYCSPDGTCYTATGQPIAHQAPAQVAAQAPAQAGANTALAMPMQGQLSQGQLTQQGQLGSSQPTAGIQLPVQSVAPRFQPKSAQLVSTTVSFEKQVEPSQPTNSSTETPALEGYCPIALQSSGGWVPGNREFAIRHRGRVYWLQNAEAVQQFMSAPDKFSPILSGYDPMVFLQEGKLVEGSVQYGLHDSVSGGVFFFSSAESKQAFEAEPERNARALTYVLRAAMK